MTLDLFTTEKGGKQTIAHDLNFAAPTYENIHTISFKNPSQALQTILRETGPLPSDEDRKARKAEGGGAVKKQKKNFDLDKMADVIPRLPEDDLMQIIQMIHDHKAEDTYINNNVDGKSNNTINLNSSIMAAEDHH
jgi:transcription initiation factor IIF auxiliary subunit